MDCDGDDGEAGKAGGEGVGTPGGLDEGKSEGEDSDTDSCSDDSSGSSSASSCGEGEGAEVDVEVEAEAEGPAAQAGQAASIGGAESAGTGGRPPIRQGLAPVRLAPQLPPQSSHGGGRRAAASADPAALRYRRELAPRMVARGELNLRLKNLPAWQALVGALLPEGGPTRRELLLDVGPGQPHYAAWLARRPGPGRSAAPIWAVGGLLGWMEGAGARVGDRAELSASPDGRLSLRVLQQGGARPAQGNGADGTGKRQPAAAAAAAEAGGGAGKRKRRSCPVVEGGSQRLTEADVRKRTVRMRAWLLNGLFRGLAERHGVGADIPVTLVDEADGSEHGVLLRGYPAGTGPVHWTLKRVWPLLERRGMRAGDTLHLRQAEGRPEGVLLRSMAGVLAGEGTAGALALAVQPPEGPPAKRLCPTPTRTAAPGPAPAPVPHPLALACTDAAPPGPAPSIACLHGCVSSQAAGCAGLPPLRPGELRLCGLTFHPDLAPAVRRALAEWEAALGDGGLANADPAEVQITMPHLAEGGGGGAGGGVEPWRAAFEEHRLRDNIVCSRLARCLGLLDGEWDAALPEGGAELPGGLEPVGDAARGGAGLAVAAGTAAAPLRRNEVVGVVGGYVMPAAAAAQFVTRGFRELRGGVAAELAGRAAPAASAAAWRFLAGSFAMPYPGLQLTPEGATGPSPLELNMLGYGNLAALVNDPRVQPRAWVDGNDVAAPPVPNCLVVPVSVRGLVLPVLVTLRDIAPGEQLLRDYGADWWRQLGRSWDNLEFDGVTPERLLHGAEGGPGDWSEDAAAGDPAADGAGTGPGREQGMGKEVAAASAAESTATGQQPAGGAGPGGAGEEIVGAVRVGAAAAAGVGMGGGRLQSAGDSAASGASGECPRGRGSSHSRSQQSGPEGC
ncbi:hypothetical protein GPECTOR_2g1273 [Gonium pectorale]|uniref:SET domain-containing protein n=1 Tax=Gonium pectorale TaxID=33097 RepID=A0A150H139_GONPE|nr:hypothetical protein GPECTOR_2g1273 [Gonium pectorale]|eukprot:KXZ55723.1 hypothetical protein GPECTOR_2g1273 [Gonium pectorale]